MKNRIAVLTGFILLGAAGPASAAINPVLTASRTSGVAPLAVFFNTAGTMDDATPYPFHEDFFQWDFGDTGSGEWRDGKSRNKEFGPLAAHVFDTPGTYTVTLTVRNMAGQQEVRTETITVEDPNVVFSGTDTACISTSSDFTGCPTGAEQVPNADMTRARQEMTPVRRVLFRRGERWSYTSRFTHMGTEMRMIGAYGTGTRPRFSLPVPDITTNHFKMDDQSENLTVMDIEFEGGNSIIDIDGEAKKIFLYRNSNVPATLGAAATAAPSAASSAGLDLAEQVFIIDNEFNDFGKGSGDCILFLGVMRSAVVGNTLSDITKGEHNFRLAHGEEVVISHNDMGPQANKKGVLTIRAENLEPPLCSGGCGRFTRRIVVSDNTLRNNSDTPSNFVGKNNSSDTVHGEDILFERNFLTSVGAPGTQGRLGIVVEDADHVTIRNNVFQLNGYIAPKTMDLMVQNVSGNSVYRIYNNTVYADVPGASPGADTILVRNFANSSGAQVIIANNLVVGRNPALFRTTPSAGFTLGINRMLPISPSPFAAFPPTQPLDFMLAAGSEPVDAGTPLPIYLDWRQGGLPVNGAYDIGAFEFGSLPSGGDSMSPAAPLDFRRLP